MKGSEFFCEIFGTSDLVFGHIGGGLPCIKKESTQSPPGVYGGPTPFSPELKVTALARRNALAHAMARARVCAMANRLQLIRNQRRGDSLASRINGLLD
jgi:hypothetical protein